MRDRRVRTRAMSGKPSLISNERKAFTKVSLLRGPTTGPAGEAAFSPGTARERVASAHQ
jgi:hypothetical protein